MYIYDSIYNIAILYFLAFPLHLLFKQFSKARIWPYISYRKIIADGMNCHGL